MLSSHRLLQVLSLVSGAELKYLKPLNSRKYWLNLRFLRFGSIQYKSRTLQVYSHAS